MSLAKSQIVDVAYVNIYTKNALTQKRFSGRVKEAGYTEKNLTQKDISQAKAIIKTQISKKLTASEKSSDTFAFGSEFIELIAEKVLLPILVGLASRALYDYLKNRRMDSLSKKETEELSHKLIGVKVSVKSQLDPQSFEELRVQLGPLGFTENDIELIFESTKNRLFKENIADL